MTRVKKGGAAASTPGSSLSNRSRTNVSTPGTPTGRGGSPSGSFDFQIEEQPKNKNVRGSQDIGYSVVDRRMADPERVSKIMAGRIPEQIPERAVPAGESEW